MSDTQPQPLEFTHIPGLGDILRSGGRFGRSYALVGSARIHHYQRDGWALVPGVPAITITTSTDSVPALLMRRGDPLPQESGGLPAYFVDPKLVEATKPTQPAQPSKPAPKEEPRAPKAQAQAAS